MRLWIRDEAHARMVLALPPTGETYADRVQAARYLEYIERSERERLGLPPRTYTWPRMVAPKRGGKR